MRLSSSSSGPSHQSQEGEQKSLNSELWHACAGPLVSLPAVGSRVVYFPQGHSEQVAASTNKEIDSHIPNYPSLPPQLICQLHDVTLHADVETDEVYAQMTLQPLSPQEPKDPFLPAELGTPSKQPTNYFCKTLTASDTSTHGGFSVPRRAAEKVFPPLDFSQQPPAQELMARDLHGNEWKFRHIFRGQPKRHLLTTGWSVFVSAKRLVAGDSVLFIWNESNQLLLGIRRASRPQTVMPSSVLSSDSMHIGLLAAAAHAAATNSRFTIFYNPRASPSEFVIPLAKYAKTVYHTRVSVGMRFRMLFETEESTVRRYMGTIMVISDLDPVRWRNSDWRSVKVGWDESTAGDRQPRVSLWEIEPLTTFLMYPSPFPPRLKRAWPSGLPYHSGIKDEDIGFSSSPVWLQDGVDRGIQPLNLHGIGVSPWTQPRLDTSLIGLQPDMYQAMATAALQDMRPPDPLKQANSVLQFPQPQNLMSSSSILPSEVLHQVQSQSQQNLLQIIQGNQGQRQTLPQFLQHQLHHFNSISGRQHQQTPPLTEKQHQQVQQHQHLQTNQQQQQQKHLPDHQQIPNLSSAMPQLVGASQAQPSSLQAISSFFQNQNFADSNGDHLPVSGVSPLHSILQSLSSQETSNHLSWPRTDLVITSGTWPSKRVAVESMIRSGAQLGNLQPSIQHNSATLPSFPDRECSEEQEVGIDAHSHLLFGVNIDSPLLMQNGISGLRSVGNESDSASMPFAAANLMSSTDTDFPSNHTLTSSNCLDESAVLQTMENNVDQINLQNGTFVKVYKSGSFGRSLDISRFSSYNDLRFELARLFGLDGQLEDPLRSGWQLVFVDRENDVLLLGDDPWQEFVNSVSCIKILSPQEVQQMGKQGVDLLNFTPLKRLSSSSCDDYRRDSRNLSAVIPTAGSLDY